MLCLSWEELNAKKRGKKRKPDHKPTCYQDAFISTADNLSICLPLLELFKATSNTNIMSQRRKSHELMIHERT